MLDATIASALKMLLTHVHFGKIPSVEEQRAQKDDRFLRQIAYMIYEHFRAAGFFVKLYKVYQIYSVYVRRMTTSKISTQDGTKLF